MRNWEESNLPDEILEAIKAKNYKRPSGIPKVFKSHNHSLITKQVFEITHKY